MEVKGNTTGPTVHRGVHVWAEIALSETWGLHAKCFKADKDDRHAGDLGNGGSVHQSGCYHAIVMEPDPLRNRQMYQLQLEGHIYLWNDGIRTTTPDSVRPPIDVLMDAKMQLLPANVLLGVVVEAAAMAAHPINVLFAIQIGHVGRGLEQPGKVPSLLHKA